jgi:hypothetical protein
MTLRLFQGSVCPEQNPRLEKNKMPSMIQMECEGQIDVIPRNEIPWGNLRNEIYYRLIKSMDSDKAEELADSAIVATFTECDECCSLLRATANCWRNLADIRRAEQARTETASDLLLDVSADRKPYSEQRTPAKETTSIREAMLNERQTREWLAWFSVEYWPVYPANDSRW